MIEMASRGISSTFYVLWSSSSIVCCMSVDLFLLKKKMKDAGELANPIDLADKVIRKRCSKYDKFIKHSFLLLQW